MTAQPTGRVVIVEVNGELDMASAKGLTSTVRNVAAEPTGAIVLELSGCPFFDSTGMSALLRLNDELAGQDIPLLLVIPTEPPARRRLVAVAGLELALVIFENEMDALESLTVEEAPAPRVERRELLL